MLERETIRKLVKKYQTTEENIWREYCQHLFLSILYQEKGSEHLYFKGGTALRIVYGSPRFSEDLDFSTPLSGKKIIERLIINALSELERIGVESSIQEAKSTTGGYLAHIFLTVGEKTVSIRIEISQRAGKKEGEVVMIASDFLPPYPLILLREDILVKEKIQALLSRKKPRDFYDIYFLLRSNMVPVAQKKMLLPKVSRALKESNISFERELKQFLPQSAWLIIRKFQNVLEREIRKFA
ncbi:MAG TPA: nucleotidyl transferase AbiEii/AbiGii toxin family protein [Syntrophales bacterium]|nr:MAG: hypothetical protein A3J06_01955 [Candidatus Moranbacteria bacterium RIFCSPLOWO2_02_FULL_48_19]OGI29876.1 MAG: hypothetical protein A3G09_04500 [Candidatus Moranbacteria bacterium RIFCSPLOWO2_12_FULL_48_12]HLE18351.1 nucleotidyl transferase AbiEii/AbiGii toxin family protein [Syntrophales bacterium]